ncbi:MAG: DUF262 domain-containing protein [Gammaproteobacteria bacterium]|nr:DUF262 domain-containing protein [Gammaproteobacteria bacterium]MCY4282355.1 DUF262 domain-containing protein [Gammaproteobacteria bacterium]MCY4337963.1 DUF262 domain-containing protein [Gammaproteobacteria bacterium]
MIQDSAVTDQSVEDTESEKIEGLDTGSGTGWGDYPLNSVFIRTATRPVGDVVRRIRNGRYQLDPDFQRDFIWPEDKQSRLIESCLMRIPLPVFYLAEAQDGRIIVVDGLQRLVTFSRFLDGKLALKGLNNNQDADKPPPELDGKRFKELPLDLQERIEDTQLTLYILDREAPERAKLNIFERVNSGVALSRQQMRNSLYNGPATRWLREASEHASFRKVIRGGLNSKIMRDREAINRFCAFYLLGYREYKAGDMDAFLARTLAKLNQQDEQKFDIMSSDFRHSMNINYLLFRDHAFRKSLAYNGYSTARTVINISLFDVFSVLFTQADGRLINDNKEHAREIARNLLDNNKFEHAISYSTNSTGQVHDRFSLAQDAFKDMIEC